MSTPTGSTPPQPSFAGAGDIARSALFTDLYELTMMAGYRQAGRADEPATFDLFHRHTPGGVELVVAAGLEPALAWLEGLAFDEDARAYLSSLGLFDDDSVEWLATIGFTGDVWAVPEGTPVFADEPLLRVTAPLAQAQLAETALLNLVSYSSLVASNAAQLAAVAGGKPLLEFGARRAHGPDGALTGSRAAYIGGCQSTSNVAAGRAFGLPVSGTQAHSWIMAFPDELAAFRAYAEAFPGSTVLLVDTYDTIGQGVPNAITVAHELAERGHQLAGIRLDSGDLDELSRRARALLDEAGLGQVKVLASGDLDADRIAALEQAGAPIDGYGVGTSLMTAQADPAFSGVYKLAEADGAPVVKISATPEKTTNPGRKQVWRGDDGDLIGLAEETHSGRPLLEQVMAGGRRTRPAPELASLQQRCREEADVVRRRVRAGTWTVEPTKRLQALRDELIAAHRG